MNKLAAAEAAYKNYEKARDEDTRKALLYTLPGAATLTGTAAYGRISRNPNPKVIAGGILGGLAMYTAAGLSLIPSWKRSMQANPEAEKHPILTPMGLDAANRRYVSDMPKRLINGEVFKTASCLEEFVAINLR